MPIHARDSAREQFNAKMLFPAPALVSRRADVLNSQLTSGCMLYVQRLLFVAVLHLTGTVFVISASRCVVFAFQCKCSLFVVSYFCVIIVGDCIVAESC
jgi:hypothetical protein